ncbi:unnamed protein product [Amoebophrya sp. A120]|nr:unnamed protein product [Amoebophrya sp. A120]|eukprot:GSA120T00021824001.1
MRFPTKASAKNKSKPSAAVPAPAACAVAGAGGAAAGVPPVVVVSGTCTTNGGKGAGGGTGQLQSKNQLSAAFNSSASPATCGGGVAGMGTTSKSNTAPPTTKGSAGLLSNKAATTTASSNVKSNNQATGDDSCQNLSTSLCKNDDDIELHDQTTGSNTSRSASETSSDADLLDLESMDAEIKKMLQQQNGKKEKRHHHQHLQTSHKGGVGTTNKQKTTVNSRSCPPRRLNRRSRTSSVGSSIVADNELNDCTSGGHSIPALKRNNYVDAEQIDVEKQVDSCNTSDEESCIDAAAGGNACGRQRSRSKSLTETMEDLDEIVREHQTRMNLLLKNSACTNHGTSNCDVEKPGSTHCATSTSENDRTRSTSPAGGCNGVDSPAAGMMNETGAVVPAGGAAVVVPGAKNNQVASVVAALVDHDENDSTTTKVTSNHDRTMDLHVDVNELVEKIGKEVGFQMDMGKKNVNELEDEDIKDLHTAAPVEPVTKSTSPRGTTSNQGVAKISSTTSVVGSGEEIAYNHNNGGAQLLREMDEEDDTSVSSVDSEDLDKQIEKIISIPRATETPRHDEAGGSCKDDHGADETSSNYAVQGDETSTSINPSSRYLIQQGGSDEAKIAQNSGGYLFPRKDHEQDNSCNNAFVVPTSDDLARQAQVVKKQETTTSAREAAGRSSSIFDEAETSKTVSDNLKDLDNLEAAAHELSTSKLKVVGNIDDEVVDHVEEQQKDTENQHQLRSTSAGQAPSSSCNMVAPTPSTLCEDESGAEKNSSCSVGVEDAAVLEEDSSATEVDEQQISSTHPMNRQDSLNAFTCFQPSNTADSPGNSSTHEQNFFLSPKTTASGGTSGATTSHINNVLCFDIKHPTSAKNNWPKFDASGQIITGGANGFTSSCTSTGSTLQQQGAGGANGVPSSRPTTGSSQTSSPMASLEDRVQREVAELRYGYNGRTQIFEDEPDLLSMTMGNYNLGPSCTSATGPIVKKVRACPLTSAVGGGGAAAGASGVQHVQITGSSIHGDHGSRSRASSSVYESGRGSTISMGSTTASGGGSSLFLEPLDLMNGALSSMKKQPLSASSVKLKSARKMIDNSHRGPVRADPTLAATATERRRTARRFNTARSKSTTGATGSFRATGAVKATYGTVLQPSNPPTSTGSADHSKSSIPKFQPPERKTRPDWNSTVTDMDRYKLDPRIAQKRKATRISNNLSLASADFQEKISSMKRDIRPFLPEKSSDEPEQPSAVFRSKVRTGRMPSYNSSTNSNSTMNSPSTTTSGSMVQQQTNNGTGGGGPPGTSSSKESLFNSSIQQQPRSARGGGASSGVASSTTSASSVVTSSIDQVVGGTKPSPSRAAMEMTATTRGAIRPSHRIRCVRATSSSSSAASTAVASGGPGVTKPTGAATASSSCSSAVCSSTASSSSSTAAATTSSTAGAAVVSSSSSSSSSSSGSSSSTTNTSCKPTIVTSTVPTRGVDPREKFVSSASVGIVPNCMTTGGPPLPKMNPASSSCTSSSCSTSSSTSSFSTTNSAPKGNKTEVDLLTTTATAAPLTTVVELPARPAPAGGAVVCSSATTSAEINQLSSGQQQHGSATTANPNEHDSQLFENGGPGVLDSMLDDKLDSSIVLVKSQMGNIPLSDLINQQLMSLQ